MSTRVGVKYFSKYLSQVQVLFHIWKYKFKYSEYLKNFKYIKSSTSTLITNNSSFHSSDSTTDDLCY